MLTLQGKYKRRKRVGRGPGSGIGKTCGRGIKGAGARSGYKRRWGTEGGRIPLYMCLPTRGFSRGRFAKKMLAINLAQIDKVFSDGDAVNEATLREKGFLSGKSKVTIKLLGNGALTKKLSITVDAISKTAENKVNEAGASFFLTCASKK